MYTLTQFGGMMKDRVRMETHVEALRRAIKPGDVVLDMGAGTGIFSLIACQEGARHVYAVEPSPAIDLGSKMAAANGFRDRITFIKGLTTEIDLPEKVDLIIGDLRGRLPIFDHNVESFADAKARHLKPGGIIIPQRDTLFLTLVSDENRYAEMMLRPWTLNPYNLDMSAALPYVLNDVASTLDRFTADQVLLSPQVWETIEYGEPANHRFDHALRWIVEKPGTAHFLHVWFDADLYDGVGFTNAPGAPEAYPASYGASTFPLKEPLALQPGNLVTVRFSAHNAGQSLIMRWLTHVYEDETAANRLKSFDQSTWFSILSSDFIKRTGKYKPVLRPHGRAVSFILQAMQSGNTTNEAIALDALNQFPDLLTNPGDALELVADIAQQYS